MICKVFEFPKNNESGFLIKFWIMGYFFKCTEDWPIDKKSQNSQVTFMQNSYKQIRYCKDSCFGLHFCNVQYKLLRWWD